MKLKHVRLINSIKHTNEDSWFDVSRGFAIEYLKTPFEHIVVTNPQGVKARTPLSNVAFFELIEEPKSTVKKAGSV